MSSNVDSLKLLNLFLDLGASHPSIHQLRPSIHPSVASIGRVQIHIGYIMVHERMLTIAKSKGEGGNLRIGRTVLFRPAVLRWLG